MNITSKKIFKLFFRLLSFAGILSLIITWNTYGKFVMAANSVKQLSNHFYYMEFKGDYKLKEYLDKGGADSNSTLAVFIENLLRGKNINKVYKNQVPLNTGCASISATTPEGQKIFGRNYDWEQDQFKTGMIIKSTPKHGYKSISTTQLDFLGFGEGFTPVSFGSKYLSSAAIFIPLDGMNEKGLCISDLMAGDSEFTNQDSGRSDLTTTLAIRAVLDFCADVPEAIALLEKYDMHSVIGYAHHFAICDASGRSVVVEYIDNKMIVTETKTVTNHYLGTQREVLSIENSTLRRNHLNQLLEEKNCLSEADVKHALYDIRASQYGRGSKSWWRAVFNQDTLQVTYSLEENYVEKAAFDFKL